MPKNDVFMVPDSWQRGDGEEGWHLLLKYPLACTRDQRDFSHTEDQYQGTGDEP